MKTCKECGERNKYGYHLLNCKVLTDCWKNALEKMKGEQK